MVAYLDSLYCSFCDYVKPNSKMEQGIKSAQETIGRLGEFFSSIAKGVAGDALTYGGWVNEQFIQPVLSSPSMISQQFVKGYNSFCGAVAKEFGPSMGPIRGDFIKACNGVYNWASEKFNQLTASLARRYFRA